MWGRRYRPPADRCKVGRLESLPHGVFMIGRRLPVDVDCVAFELDGLAGADFAAFSGFELAINADEPLSNDLFAFASGHYKVGGFE